MSDKDLALMIIVLSIYAVRETILQFMIVKGHTVRVEIDRHVGCIRRTVKRFFRWR